MEAKRQSEVLAQYFIGQFECCRCFWRGSESVPAKIIRYGAPFCSGECAEAASDATLEEGNAMIPDWWNDREVAMRVLNAVPLEKAERFIHYLRGEVFGFMVNRELNYAEQFRMQRATAAQICRAFLKTMDLWQP
jgi:hypothetical protein